GCLKRYPPRFLLTIFRRWKKKFIAPLICTSQRARRGLQPNAMLRACASNWKSARKRQKRCGARWSACAKNGKRFADVSRRCLHRSKLLLQSRQRAERYRIRKHGHSPKTQESKHGNRNQAATHEGSREQRRAGGDF